jgi:hypothetical protein
MKLIDEINFINFLNYSVILYLSYLEVLTPVSIHLQHNVPLTIHKSMYSLSTQEVYQSVKEIYILSYICWILKY